MLSIRKLFEVTTYAPRAQSPMADSRSYVNERIANLKRQFAFGRIRSASYTQQLKELQKQKLDKLSGTFVEK